MKQNKKIRAMFVCLLFLCILIPSYTVTHAEEMLEREPAAVTELDLGEYQSEMSVGEKQLLTVTALPLTVGEQQITYSSSNPSVASINGLGRITAVSQGSVTITAACGSVSSQFTLTVIEKKAEEKIEVRDLDLGDCPSELEVGSSQILGATVIPVDATEQKIEYRSSNPSVVTVNAIGRVMALKTGKAKITLTSGTISKFFWVKVVEKRQETISVSAIDIESYEKELEVDKTMKLSVTVLPADATETALKYASSDPAVATVSPSGEIKGIAPGKVSITVSCGKVKKRARIKVVIPTANISMNSDYLVMKPGEQFQLRAQVTPSDASGQIRYSTQEKDAFRVNGQGLVTAVKCGNGSVIVSNGATSVAVTVIINENGEEKDEQTHKKKKRKEETYPDEVTAEEYPVITAEMLRYYYEEKKTLTIVGDGYRILLDGIDIVNCDNPFRTELLFTRDAEGVHFAVNEGEKLCGTIMLSIDSAQEDDVLYLYNNSKKKYEKLDIEDFHEIPIDQEGDYLLANQALSSFRVNRAMLGGFVGCILVLAGVFVLVKKRYWFW